MSLSMPSSSPSHQNAWTQIKQAFGQWKIAWLLARADWIELRRLNGIALVSPFLSVVVQIVLLGSVFTNLFGVSMADYLPHFGVGFVLWQSLSSYLSKSAYYNDHANVYRNFANISPYVVHLSGILDAGVQLVVKLMALALTMAVFAPAVLAKVGYTAMLFALLVYVVFIFLLGIVSAYLLDRIRLLRGTLGQMLMILGLITPIIWQPDQLKQNVWIADWNPVYHIIETVRAPILTGQISWLSLVVTLSLIALMIVLIPSVHRRNADQLAFRWVA